MQAIGVIGCGFVGSAVKAGFEEHFKVNVFDRNPEKSNVCGLDCLLAETDGPIFVSVPTPMKPDGSCDTSIVESVIDGLETAAHILGLHDKVVVIKSTVRPGTTQRIAAKLKHISLVFNPEFLTEANFVDDFKQQQFILLGGVQTAVLSDYAKPLQLVTEAYQKALPKAEVHWWTATGCELFKYVCNTFLALKVSYANELRQVCDKLDVEYEDLLLRIRYDNRLGHTHWRVPGPDGQFGFSGSCFPKDVNGLLSLARELGVNMRTLEAAWATNLEVRPSKDWEQLKGRAVV